MAKKSAPALVIMMAILCFLFTACAGGMSLVGVIGSMGRGTSGSEEDTGKISVDRELEQRVPTFRTIQMARSVSGVAFAFLMLICGIGLLMLQQWARILGIVYAIVHIFSAVMYMFFNFFVIFPVARDISASVDQGAAFYGGWIGGAVAASCFDLLFPFIVLIVMLLPDFGKAFRRKRRRVEEDSDDEPRYPRRGPRRGYGKFVDDNP